LILPRVAGEEIGGGWNDWNVWNDWNGFILVNLAKGRRQKLRLLLFVPRRRAGGRAR